MKATKLRHLFEEKALIRTVGAHDGLTAKLVEINKFDGIWASGLEISASHMVPDASILTMTDFLEAAIEMNEATSIPIIADCDTGFGNLNNVARMVSKYESNGIAAVCIEEKKHPKINSLYCSDKDSIVPIHDFVAKLIAARKARKTKDFMIFARIEALVLGLESEEAIKRAKAYAQAGADGIFVHAKAQQQIVNFVKEWDGEAPLIICPTLYPSFTEKEIRRLKKIKMVIYANHILRTAIMAINSTLNEIYHNGIVKIDKKITSLSEVFELQGMNAMVKNEKKILKLTKKQWSLLHKKKNINE
ncbi:MAG: isocitrate lyase/phosphoenolpyruvate mutase family protein [Candidatus Hodarchaeota archaeon]